MTGLFISRKQFTELRTKLVANHNVTDILLSISRMCRTFLFCQPPCNQVKMYLMQIKKMNIMSIDAIG